MRCLSTFPCELMAPMGKAGASPMGRAAPSAGNHFSSTALYDAVRVPAGWSATNAGRTSVRTGNSFFRR